MLKEENRALIRKSGTVDYLHALPEILLERTRCDNSRPLPQVADPEMKLPEHYAARDPVYRQTADFTVESANCRKPCKPCSNAYPDKPAHAPRPENQTALCLAGLWFKL